MTLPSTSNKHWLTSRTNISAFVVLVSLISRKAGYEIGDEAGWTNVIIEALGALGAIYFRGKAIKRIGT